MPLHGRSTSARSSSGLVLVVGPDLEAKQALCEGLEGSYGGTALSVQALVAGACAEESERGDELTASLRAGKLLPAEDQIVRPAQPPRGRPRGLPCCPAALLPCCPAALLRLHE